MLLQQATKTFPFGTVDLYTYEDQVAFLTVFQTVEAQHLAKQDRQRLYPHARICQHRSVLHNEVFHYLENLRQIQPDFPLYIQGTSFQKSVWEVLYNIPKGKTLTYGEIARLIQRPKAVRAVGTAVGANPISILIPCHRVLPKSGGLGNYRWGSSLKQALLQAEGFNHV